MLPGSQRDSPWPTHATAAGSRTKDTRPPCDGILRQLRCLRMARCPAGRLAAVAAHRAGVGWGGNVGRYRAIHRLLEIYSRLLNVYSTGHTGTSTIYSESIESIIDLLSSIGAIVPIGEMDTQGRWGRYADDLRLRRNLGRCYSGRWCQASVVEHSLRPAASVRCGGRKAVSRIRQSSRAGQPNTSGSMRDLLAAESLRKSRIKGNKVWETVSGFRFAPPATDSHPVYPPDPQGR